MNLVQGKLLFLIQHLFRFSVVFWIYIEEYCIQDPSITLCAILQHLTFDRKHLTPELYINREGLLFFFPHKINILKFDFSGNLVAHIFGSADHVKIDHAKTLASIPKKDWCRIVFVVHENLVNID